MEDSAHSDPDALTHGEGQPPSRLDKLAPWLVLALIALGFVRCLGFEFVNWDDGLHVLGNPAVTGTGDARDRWLTPALGYAIPVTVSSYRLEYELAGGAPWIYHATNLLLHLGVCGLVYLLGRCVGLSRIGAGVGMLFFGLHPVVAEPVSWVSGRKDLLATFFALGATWWLWRASPPVATAKRGLPPRSRPAGSDGDPPVTTAPSSSVVTVVVTTSLFALATLSKPSVLALPLFWALAAGSGGVWRTRRDWLPALAVAAVVATVSWIGQRHVGAVATTSVLPWARQMFYGLGYHLGLALFVQQPLAKHIPEKMPPPFDAAVDLLPLAAAILVWLWLRRRQHRSARIVRLGLLFAGLAYLPSAGIVPLVRYLADSYVYLPLVGVAWLVGAAAESIGPRLRRGWAWASGLAVAAALLLGASTASMAWHDSVALWTAVSERYPDSPQVCLNLGNAFFERGQAQTALDLYERCSRQFGPEYFAKNRAVALFVLGRHAEAAPIFRQLAVRFPGDAVVRKYLGYLASERVPPDERE